MIIWLPSYFHLEGFQLQVLPSHKAENPSLVLSRDQEPRGRKRLLEFTWVQTWTYIKANKGEMREKCKALNIKKYGPPLVDPLGL